MKAIGFTEHGDINKMALLALPKPKPGPGEALIEIKASAYNRLDIWVRQGWPGLNLKLPHISGSLRAVKRGGRIVIVGNTSGPKTELDIRFLFTKQISLIGSTMGSHSDYREVMQLVFSGALKPVIHTVMPLEEGVEAMALLERGEQFGKVVLER